MRLYLFAIIIIFFSASLFGQVSVKGRIKADPEKAMEYYKYGNYYDAIEELEKLVIISPGDLTYRALLGFAYLNTTLDRAKAVEHFEHVIKDPKADVYVYYDLGRAYMLTYQFDKAISHLETFLKKNNEKEKDVPIPSKRLIEMCHYAKSAFDNRQNVIIENVGSLINSEYPDYNAFVDEYETKLFFTSRRKGNTGNYKETDGLLTADVYMSKVEGDTWAKPRKLSSVINSYLIEESVGMTADGNDLLVYVYSEMGMDDVFISSLKGRNYRRMEYLTTNSKWQESGATISPDKRFLVFSSSRPGGKGGKDLYIAKKLPNGMWSEPFNLGAEINTPFDEDFPQFDPNGTTLYFSSTGHEGMGGYDLFKTTFDPVTMEFTHPENLGFPINTPDDNKTISFTKSGRYAYISDLRPGGTGNLDVYKVIFLDVPAPYITYAGHFFNIDSVEIFEARREEIERVKKQILNMEASIEKEKHKIEDFKSRIEAIGDDRSDLSVKRLSVFQTSIETSQATIDGLLEVEIPQAQEELKELEIEIEIKIHLLNTANKSIISSFEPHPKTGEFAVIAQPGNYIIRVESNSFETWEGDFIIPEREQLPDPYLYNIYIENPAPKLFK